MLEEKDIWVYISGRIVTDVDNFEYLSLPHFNLPFGLSGFNWACAGRGVKIGGHCRGGI
jgi:hypothetical protein